MWKKLISTVLALALMLSFGALAEPNEPSHYTQRVSSTGELMSRLQEIMNRYVGTYWTQDGDPSSYYKDSKYYYGWQCKGFACYVFNELFKTGNIGNYDETYKYFLVSPSYATEVARLVNVGAADAAAVKGFLSKARVGDLVQMKRRSTSNAHTMIITAVSDTGVSILDCNSDGFCKVQSYYQDWRTFASLNLSMTLYHSTVYPSDDAVNPVITSANIANVTPTGYDVVCTATDNAALARIQIGSWNDIVGIDAAVWKEAVVWGTSASATLHVDISDFGGAQNTAYTTNVYAIDACGNLSPAVRAGSVTLEANPPRIIAARVENVTGAGYDVVCEATDDVGVAAIQIGTWHSGISVDDAKWQQAAAVDGQARFHVDIADFDYAANVVYHTNAYAFDRCGNVSAAMRCGDPEIVYEQPTVTRVELVEASSIGYILRCTAAGDSPIRKLTIGTWHEGMSIDDAVWKEAEAVNGEALLAVSIADFGNVRDVVYHTNVFAEDSLGHVSEARRGIDILMEATPPEVVECRVSNVTDQGYDVTVAARDNSELRSIQIGTWHSGISVDNAKWQEAAVVDGQATFRVNIADFGGAQGVTYRTNAYAFDRCGNVSTGVRAADVPVSSLPEWALVLPAGLVEVHDEAFIGTAARTVYVPDGCRYIGAGAFAASAVEAVCLPDSLEEIGDGALPDGAVVYAPAGSQAAEWAEEHGHWVVNVRPDAPGRN